MKNKVFISFVEAGMGHIMTARAIKDSLNKLNSNYNIDIIAENLFLKNKTLENHQFFLAKETLKASKYPLHSRIQLFFMKILGERWTLSFVNSIIFRKALNSYVAELNKIKPDIIIDTHFFTSFASTKYKEKYNPNCTIITYNPDNNVHGWWNRKVDKFIVNNDNAFNEAIKKHFKLEQLIKVFFITRQGVIDCNQTKEHYKNKYNIPKDKFSIILSDGAYAKAKLKPFLFKLLHTKKPITLVAITGKNEKLYNKLINLQPNLPNNITLIPLKFEEKIYEIIKACDLFITKAGPNAILDSVFVQTPFLINYYANLIEKSTKKLFSDTLNCGKTIKNKHLAKKFIEKCIDNPRILVPYTLNQQKLDKTNNGADDIAKYIFNVLLKIAKRKNQQNIL